MPPESFSRAAVLLDRRETSTAEVDHAADVDSSRLWPAATISSSALASLAEVGAPNRPVTNTTRPSGRASRAIARDHASRRLEAAIGGTRGI